MKEIIEDIKMELSILKVQTDMQDKEIGYYIKQVKQKILNTINSDTLPDKLEYVLIKRVVGEILKTLVASNNLIVNNEKVEQLQVSSITRGDVSMSYKGASTSDTFNSIIKTLVEYGNDEILRYRVIKWI